MQVDANQFKDAFIKAQKDNEEVWEKTQAAEQAKEESKEEAS